MNKDDIEVHEMTDEEITESRKREETMTNLYGQQLWQKLSLILLDCPNCHKPVNWWDDNCNCGQALIEFKESIVEREKKEQSKENIILDNKKITIDNYKANVESFYEIQPFFCDKTGLFWFWDNINHKYTMFDDIDVMRLLDKRLGFDGALVSKGLKANYLEAFRWVGREHMPKPAPSKWVQFKDKAYSITSDVVYNVQPNYFFTNPIPWELGSSTETPTMDKLFKEWVGEKHLAELYELIAYTCYSDYPIQLIFCLYGSGRNGKSQFLKLLNRFIGKENICSTELDTLIENRFESFKLYKKLICTMGETNFGVMRKTSLLKKLVGGDLIGFEKKNKDPFDDVNYAKIIIASNSLPSSDDTSDGFMRRWHIIDFPNEFPEGKEIIDTIPITEYNNLALKSCKILKKLLNKGEFSNQGTINERKKKYMMVSNPLPIFLDEYCEIGDDKFVKYGELYTAYVHFLNENKKRKVMKKEFRGAIEDEGYFIDRTSKKVGEGQNGYPVMESSNWVDGIALKPNWRSLCKKCINVSDSTQSSYAYRPSDNSLQNYIFYTKFEVLDLILQKMGQNNQPVAIQDIISAAPVVTDDLIEEAKKQGLIFEPKPGYIARL